MYKLLLGDFDAFDNNLLGKLDEDKYNCTKELFSEYI